MLHLPTPFRSFDKGTGCLAKEGVLLLLSVRDISTVHIVAGLVSTRRLEQSSLPISLVGPHRCLFFVIFFRC